MKLKTEHKDADGFDFGVPAVRRGRVLLHPLSRKTVTK